MEGVIVLDKPAGLTSARAVDAVKRLLPRGTKVGHAGTLDPFATGVLLVLVGRATKSCERLMDRPKTYEATVKLGATTETDDPESPEVPWPNVRTLRPGHLRVESPRVRLSANNGRRPGISVRCRASFLAMPQMVFASLDLAQVSFPRVRLDADA